MASQSSIKLTKLVERFELKVLNEGKNYDRCLIRADDINRPALQILGFFDYFAPDRIQVIGKVEWTYLSNQSSEERRKCFDAFFEKPIPALILTRSLEPFPELMEMAIKHKRTILGSKEDTSIFIPNFTDWLKARLSPRITRHGVLVDVYGEGVLLMGDSGVGKSETAVELVKRGHRLVADDAVEIKRISDTLHGTAPELIRHYIEIRGVGVIDVKQLFGMGAVQFETEIDLVIQLEQWQDGKFYDRLGLGEETYTLLDVSLPIVTIPVRPGRNLAGIVEITTMKNRQTKYGYNAGRDFVTQFDSKLDAMTQQNGSDLL